jgi:hypothetical protein
MLMLRLGTDLWALECMQSAAFLQQLALNLRKVYSEDLLNTLSTLRTSSINMDFIYRRLGSRRQGPQQKRPTHDTKRDFWELFFLNRQTKPQRHVTWHETLSCYMLHRTVVCSYECALRYITKGNSYHTIIAFPGIIRPYFAFFKEHRVSETRLCTWLRTESSLLGPVHIAGPYVRTGDGDGFQSPKCWVFQINRTGRYIMTRHTTIICTYQYHELWDTVQ